MKIKSDFILRQMAGSTVVVPCGANVDMDMMITLNDSGRFLWEQLQTDKSVDELTAAVLAEYEIDEATAKGYVQKFVDKLKELDFLV